MTTINSTLPSVTTLRSGAGAAPAAAPAAAPKANLDAFSGAGGPLTQPGGDKVQQAEADYLPKMSDEQRAMYNLQKEVNRQSEAASLMASLMKADHDARMAIIQKIG
jgi:hypothetical protein